MGGALGSVPMLGARPAVLEDDPDADPCKCGEGSDGNEGEQKQPPAPGAQEFHEELTIMGLSRNGGYAARLPCPPAVLDGSFAPVAAG
jgi:hypothetical protein